jgi:hypothetical protein
MSGRVKPRLADEGGQDINPPTPEEPEDERDTGGTPSATSPYPLKFLGGVVQTAPRIYLVFWGPNWFRGGDPSGVANRLHAFYSALGGSSWANVLRQYSGAYSTSFTNPASQYVGWIQDNTPVPAQPTHAQMEGAAKRAAARVKDFNYNAQYVIATPWGVVDQYTTQQKACAWHSYSLLSGVAAPSGSWVTYTSLPYMPYMDYILAGSGTSCGGGWVNGTSGQLDGVTILASHEYGETVNNPSGGTWRDALQDENADKCAWVNVQNRQFTNGSWFPVQSLWSNLWKSQYNNGCLYS